MELWMRVVLEVLALLGVTITGAFGLVKGWFGFKISSSNSKRDDFAATTEILFNQLDLLRSDNELLRTENTELKAELLALRNHVREIDIELRILRAGYFESPLATWVKDDDGRMLFISEQYEKLFLTPIGKTRAEYIGNTDEVIWGEETAKDFRAHDQIVRNSNKVWVGVENHEHMGVNIFEKFYFMKYPFNPDGKGIIQNHVAGIALPITDDIIAEIIKNNT